MATKDRTSLKNDFANGKYATGEKFADLIDSMKVVQLPVVDPQALGTSLSFIDSISQDADGKITVTKKRMSPTVGSFQFVANDATAEAAFTAVGAKYSGAISGVSPSADTLGVILLMNDDDTTPTKTMMITTEEVTPATNPATYQFVYVGDLQSALTSGVLTAADIVNGFTGGVDKVLGAEAGKRLKGEINDFESIFDSSVCIPIENKTIAPQATTPITYAWSTVQGAKAIMVPLVGSGVISYTQVSGVFHNLKLLSSSETSGSNILGNVEATGTSYDSTTDKYLYIQILQSTNRLPSHVYVDGYDILVDIKANLLAVQNELRTRVFGTSQLADGAVTTEKIANGSVDYSKRTKTGSVAVIVSSVSGCPLAFDSGYKTLTIEVNSRVICGAKKYNLSPFSESLVIDITDYSSGILLFDTSYTYASSGAFILMKYNTDSALDSLSEEKYVFICSWKNFGVDGVNSNTAFTVDGNKSGFVLDDAPTLGSTLGVTSGGVYGDLLLKSNIGILLHTNGGIPLQFSSTNNTCTIPASTKVFINSSIITTTAAATTLDLTKDLAGTYVTTGGVIVYDKENSEFKVVKNTYDTYNKNFIVIATYSGLGTTTTGITINTPSLYSLNGKTFGYSSIGVLMFRNGNGRGLEFNTTTNTCTIPKGTSLVFNSGLIFITTVSADTVIDLSGLNTGSGTIVYNLISGDVEVVNWQTSLNKYYIILATFGFFNRSGYKPAISCPSFFTVDGVPYGLKHDDIPQPIEIISPEYEVIPLPSSEGNTVTWWSDFIIININGVDEMWLFTPSDSGSAKIHRVRMSDWTLIGSLTHNFGHCNTCCYDAENDILLIGDLPENPGSLYLFYNISSWANLADGSNVTIVNENPTIVSLASLEIGSVSACFAESNGTKKNIVQVQSYNIGQGKGKYVKLLLGMGTNQLSNGTYDSNHTGNDEYNGTFEVLGEVVTYKHVFNSLKNEVIQGEDYYRGKVLTSNGHGTVWGFIWDIGDDGSLRRKEIQLVTYSDDGSTLYNTAEGIATKDGWIYQGFIPVTSAAGTTKDTTRPFAIIKYQV